MDGLSQVPNSVFLYDFFGDLFGLQVEEELEGFLCGSSHLVH